MRLVRPRRSGRHWHPRHLLDQPTRLITVAYAAITAIGSAALLLPISSTTDTTLVQAVFTATSALSLTGLTVVDTGTHWSIVGQCVLMALMQIGGLGIMTATSLLGLLVARRLGLRTRILVQTESAAGDLAMVRQLLAGVLRISLTIEAITWLALALRLWLGYDESFGRAAYLGLFHAVSAYNNGGFALWPDSLGRFATDLLVLLPISLSFVLGALGYPVLRDLRHSVHPQQWSVHTRLTLITFAVLAGLGTTAVVLIEFTNPQTVGVHGGVADKLVAGIFSGLTAGSAGFSVIDYAHAGDATLLISDVLTFVGGGSAGTAGGIKLTTLAVLSLAVLAEVRGDREIHVLSRRLDTSTVRQALSVVMLAFGCVLISTLLILHLVPTSLSHALFEVVSAFANGGLSTGLTGQLPDSGQVLLVVLMLLGRIGPVTVATSLALRSSQRLYRYPQARPLVG